MKLNRHRALLGIIVKVQYAVILESSKLNMIAFQIELGIKTEVNRSQLAICSLGIICFCFTPILRDGFGLH